MKPLFHKTKNKKVIIVFSAVVILAGLIFFVAKPLYKKLYSAKDDLARENLILENLIEEGNKVDKYKDLEQKMRFNSQTVDEALVKKDNEIELIKKIEEIAKELDIKTEISAYAPPKKKNVINEEVALDQTPVAKGGANTAVPTVASNAEPAEKASYLMVSMIGIYPQFLNFLYKMENLSLIVKIESVKIKSLSQFELEKILGEMKETEGEEVEKDIPTLKSDILISYTPK